MPSELNSKKILILCPYPRGGAPGQRFRYEMYLDELKDYNLEYVIQPFLDEATNRILFEYGMFFKKAFGVLRGYWRRFLTLFKVRKFDFVFIFREASPLGPPVFEWIITKLLRKKIIYDFDDAIFLPFKSESNSITNLFKFTRKVNSICKWSYKISCGNAYLANYAESYNSSVYILPTVVDTELTHNRLKVHEGIATNVGWTGSHSTNFLIKLVVPAIKNLQKKYNLNFIVISSLRPEFAGINSSFIKWNKESEIEDLFKIDIGIMPLTDDNWTRGKCGFKAIQYLSLGIPAVVSPVGVNSEIIKPDITGYLANNILEWEQYLEQLIQDPELRNRIGENGRIHVEGNYSKRSTLLAFVDLFS